MKHRRQTTNRFDEDDDSISPPPSPNVTQGDEEESDEEIDEDCAFNSDDERKYGALFKSSSSSKKKSSSSGKKKSAKDDDDDDDNSSSSSSSESDDGLAGTDDDTDGEENDGGDYMLSLLDRLDPSTSTSSKNDGEREAKAEIDMGRSRPMSEQGASVRGGGGRGGGETMTLGRLMEGIAGTEGFDAVRESLRTVAAADAMAEVEVFDRYGNEGVENDKKKGGKLTFSRPTVPLDSSNATPRIPSAPLPAVKSERIKRKIAYADVASDMGRWIETVQSNRRCETLDFRPKDRHILTRDKLVDKFEATTDFEREVHAALDDANALDEREMAKVEEGRLLGDSYGADDGENDDLGRNQLSPEEYRRRRSELAKARALLFYEEVKNHHINKIKSKKYRRIRKRQRTRRLHNDDGDEIFPNDDDDGEEEERVRRETEEYDRMKERMSLAHKNTSKWAKRILRRGGKGVDTETRKALSAQLKIGDDLRKKMMGDRNDDSDDDGGGDDGKDTDLLDQARKILQETENDKDGDGKNDKGLMSMAFMKRGVDAQRERAKEEARDLLRELEDNQQSSGDDDDDDDDKEDDESDDGRRHHAGIIGDRAISSVPVALSVQGNIEVDLGGGGRVNNKKEKGIDTERHGLVGKESSTGAWMENHTATFRASKNSINDSDVGISATGNKKRTLATCKVGADSMTSIGSTVGTRTKLQTASKVVGTRDSRGSNSNPWLPQDGGTTAELVTDDGERNTDATISIQSPEKDIPESVPESRVVIRPDIDEEKNNVDDIEEGDVGIEGLSQAELVRKAFAIPEDSRINEEFAREKEETAARDEERRTGKGGKRSGGVGDNKNSSKGWGSWTGEGIASLPPPPPLAGKSRKRAGSVVKRKKRRDDGRENIIISEKRSKKNAKFQILDVPYPYTSREEYERAMKGALGSEWNVTGAVKDMTRPAVATRAGKIIRPISKRAKAKQRPPAKF